MFASYNLDKFPCVKVDISGTIINNEDFFSFTQQWLNLYNNKKSFEFIFNTQNAGLIDIKYCFYMAMFIKVIKKKPIQYLTKSTIYVYNKYIFHLFKFIFFLEKPIAPVILIFKTNLYEQIEYISN